MSILIGLAGDAAAQEEIDRQFTAAMARTQTVIDGVRDPDRVPQRLRLLSLFVSWQRHRAAVAGLTEADLAQLDAFAATHLRVLQADANSLAPRYDALVQQAEQLSGPQIAAEEAAIRDANHRLAEQRYEQVLSQLSEDGRRTLEAYAYKHIRPTVTSDDPVALAAAMPDAYKLWFLQAVTLPLPPPPKSSTPVMDDFSPLEVPTDEPPAGSVSIGTNEEGQP